MAGTSSIFKNILQNYREPTFEEFREATRLHAIGTEWEFISEQLGVSIEELMTWPERYPEDWDRFVKDTETQLFRQARSEGMAGARRLVSSENPRIALEAAKALLNYAKAHERFVLLEMKEKNRLEREHRKAEKEPCRNVNKQQERPDCHDSVGPAVTSRDRAENNQPSAHTTPDQTSPEPRERHSPPIAPSPQPTSEKASCSKDQIAPSSELHPSNITLEPPIRHRNRSTASIECPSQST
jgi:hypothetical protein